MMLFAGCPLLVSRVHALLGFRCAPNASSILTFPHRTNLVSEKIRAGSSRVARPSPRNLVSSLHVQQPATLATVRFEGEPVRSELSLRIVHMCALLPSFDPSGALGSGSMPANPLTPCANPCRLRKASASFVASIPCGSCMVIMKCLSCRCPWVDQSSCGF